MQWLSFEGLHPSNDTKLITAEGKYPNDYNRINSMKTLMGISSLGRKRRERRGEKEKGDVNKIPYSNSQKRVPSSWIV
jgi:hypothetical protein